MAAITIGKPETIVGSLARLANLDRSDLVRTTAFSQSKYDQPKATGESDH
jgi:hypothetical protein